MDNKNLRFGRKAALAIGAILTMSAFAPVKAVQAQDNTSAPSLAPSAEATAASEGVTITLEPGRAQKISFPLKVTKANVLVPDIADVVPLTPNDLLVTGKKPGMTQLIIWDEAHHTQILNIEVSSPIAVLRKQIHSLFPDSNIKAEDANGTITLTGEVHDLETANEVTQLAMPYGSKVLNLLEIGGGQQVMLKVKFAEVSKQAESELGFNFGGADSRSFFSSNVGKNPFGISSANGVDQLTSSVVTASMFGQGGFGKIAFQYFIDALQTDNVLRMLAEPNLVTTSGQEATFLAGGSYPYPVPQTGTGGSTTITIQFQDYGVNLKFTPIVLGNGRIRMKVAPEVSELDYSNSVSLDGTTIPGLTKRNVNTTVELGEGQTLAIGGLLQDTVTAQNTQFPLLGDVPVLGALFRSVEYQKNETELVVLVTPVLVHGMNPADVTAVPGESWHDPNELQLFLLKDLGSEIVPVAQPAKPAGPAPQFHGDFGFQPPAAPATSK